MQEIQLAERIHARNMLPPSANTLALLQGKNCLAGADVSLQTQGVIREDTDAGIAWGSSKPPLKDDLTATQHPGGPACCVQHAA